MEGTIKATEWAAEHPDKAAAIACRNHLAAEPASIKRLIEGVSLTATVVLLTISRGSYHLPNEQPRGLCC